jgi:CotH kinase protein
MSVQQQQALDSLYAIDNVLTVKITMPQADWDAVRTQQPAGGVCNFEFSGDSRYTWREAASVEISGTNSPARTTFTRVGVKKKSFCGSINSDKPCLHIDFGKFSDDNASAAQALFGSRYITLNNSIQDRSYIRQTLGYKLLGMAGLPHSRCNYAKVFVNGKLIGQGVPGVNGPGIYVSAEPVMKRYIERNFDGNMNGNLYEIEHHDDFVSARLPFIGTESLSQFQNKADLKFSDDFIAANGLAGAVQVLDLDEFVKLFAMEFLLKHWDGYSNNTNNTYVYNDVKAVESPGAGDITFKVIPWGIDQILQPTTRFNVATNGLIAKLVNNDATRRLQLIEQIRTYKDNLLSTNSQRTVLGPMIDQLQALLVGLGVPNVVAEIATVRSQLQLAEAAAGSLLPGGWRDLGGDFPPAARVAAVSRNSNQLDIFACGVNGHVQTNWWNPGDDWANHRWRDLGGSFPPAARVAAVSRNANQLDIFACGVNGHVQTNWWNPADDWAKHGWRDLGGRFPPGATVAAVSRNPNQLDIFACDVSGRVQTNWWNPGDDWAKHGWLDLGGNLPPAARVAAVSRNADQLDIFACAANGHVLTNWWNPGDDWAGHAWRDLGGGFPPGARVAAVSPNPDRLDVFVCDTNGHVRTTWWTGDDDWSDHGWRDLGGSFPPGAAVAAVSREPDQLDVFVVDSAGHLQTNRWSPGDDWADPGWRDLGGQFPAGTATATASRNPSQLDVFVCDTGGDVQTMWWTV